MSNARLQTTYRDEIAPALFKALELGNVMDEAFATKNIKQQGGAIGLLTQGHATRQSSYQQALLLAMAPFNHSELFASTR